MTMGFAINPVANKLATSKYRRQSGFRAYQT